MVALGQAVTRHLPGCDRGRGAAQGAGRRRSGHDVRIRVRRDAGADAGADPLRTPPDRERHREYFESGELDYLRPDAKSQVTVQYDEDDKPAAVDRRRLVDAARTDDVSHDRDPRRMIEKRDRADTPGGPARQRHDLPRESDRPLRGRRADGRRRPDRAQDHRRHLRRHGAPRRRRLLGQGSRRRSTAVRPTPRATWRRTW